jgi:hypothetical protein
MRAIQFETAVNGNVILIPEQYINIVPPQVNVTIVPVGHERPKFKPKTKTKPAGIDEFPAIIDTNGWRFSREEANERG